jgi:ATP-dependent Zn protease
MKHRVKTTKAEISTAYHEAGHAVAAFFLHLSIGRKGVTIIPDKINNSLGSAHVLAQLRENPELSDSPRTHVRIEDYAVMGLAGDVAEKKFHPRRRFGGHRDLNDAANLLSYISGSNEVVQARMNVAIRCARDLVNCRWKEITAVATDLLEKKTLTGREVKEIIVREWGFKPTSEER